MAFTTKQLAAATIWHTALQYENVALQNKMHYVSLMLK